MDLMEKLKKVFKKNPAQKTPDAESLLSPEEQKKKKRKKLLITALAALAVVTVAIILQSAFGVQSKKSVSSVSYTKGVAEMRDLTQTLSVTGTLAAGESYTVVSTVSGEITYSSFSQGDKVKKGETLYIINSTELSSKIKQAKATVASEKKNYQSALAARENLSVKASASGVVTSIAVSTGERVSVGDVIAVLDNTKPITASAEGTVNEIRITLDSDVVSGEVVAVISNSEITNQVQSAKTSLENAESSLESLNIQLSDYTITAPISGTVVEKTLKKGEMAEVGKQLCIVYDLTYLSLTLNVDELDILSVEKGQSVSITAEATESASYSGTVKSVSVVGSTSGGVTSYPVVVQITDAGQLLPGMNVSALIKVISKENVLSVPVAAVLRGNRVLVPSLETGEGAPEGYKYVEVTLGVSDGDYIEITEGLSEGDEIAIAVSTSVPSEETRPSMNNERQNMPSGDFPGAQGGGN